jgi:hypothetical protein
VLALRQAVRRASSAVPVASAEACEAMQVDADDVVCLATRSGSWPSAAGTRPSTRRRTRRSSAARLRAGATGALGSSPRWGGAERSDPIAVFSRSPTLGCRIMRCSQPATGAMRTVALAQ